MDLEVLRSQDLPFWGPLRSWDPPDLGSRPLGQHPPVATRGYWTLCRSGLCGRRAISKEGKRAKSPGLRSALFGVRRPPKKGPKMAPFWGPQMTHFGGPQMTHFGVSGGSREGSRLMTRGVLRSPEGPITPYIYLYGRPIWGSHKHACLCTCTLHLRGPTPLRAPYGWGPIPIPSPIPITSMCLATLLDLT